ncbi:MAG TPA: hypothetical protein VKQ52_11160 [Puia sp.]|nr:hypothetical protein [Puia sp.]
MKPRITTTDPQASASPVKSHFSLTKYMLFFVLLIAVVLNGLTGYHLFQHSNYDLSSLMIIASYLSIVMSIYVLTVSRRKPAIH